MHSLLTATLLLAAAAVAVPVAKRLGLGAVLGYLAAGIAIGPSGLGVVTDIASIVQVSHLGVVMLLFLIGLELRPARLWIMRKAVFGLGGAQVLACSLVLAGLAASTGLFTGPAVAVAGFAFALSSTALVLPLLAERDLLSSRAGRSAFAILLFQDLAVIPAVALLPLLGSQPVEGGESLVLSVARGAAALAGLLLAGRFLVRPLFRLVASARSQEVFTAAALLIVLGTAGLADAAGLPMSLGAFLAGVILSDSEYRHELEVDIEPFKGLLLGMFFMGVGMSMDAAPLIDRPWMVLGMTIGAMAAKMAAVFAVARLGGHGPRGALRLGAALAGGGEFAFVLFDLARDKQIMAPESLAPLGLAVTLSMVAAPLLFTASERLAARLGGSRAARPFDTVPDIAPPVIICGFGRMGQIVGRILRSRGIPFTALDANVSQVDFVRRFGSKVYYGDPTRAALLRAAGADKARILVVALDDMEMSLKVVETARRDFPHLQILARARNRRHAHLLMDFGLGGIVRETFHSSLVLSEKVLSALGLPGDEAAHTVRVFRRHDERTLLRQHAIHRDEDRLIQSAQQAAEELRGLFEADAEIK